MPASMLHKVKQYEARVARLTLLFTSPIVVLDEGIRICPIRLLM